MPYHKVTDLEQRQNILQRLFGIWQLGIYTPGTSSVTGEGVATRPEVAFQGLPDPDEATEAIAKILSQFKATGE
ncbi:MAG: PH domain-containing protein [Candidatus Brocadiaceae bacterium]|nr:PH domain-containing protein [Candidatus Brocadiaceae bacterium]